MSEASSNQPSSTVPFVEIYPVAMTVANNKLCVLLRGCETQPYRGVPELPGAPLSNYDDLSDAATGILSTELGIKAIPFVEQVHVWSRQKADPRGQGISIGYYSLIPSAELKRASRNNNLALATIDGDYLSRSVRLTDENGEIIDLAFDHNQILAFTVNSLRSRLWYAPKFKRRPSARPLALLPETFTVPDLQHIFEAILGVTINKDDFRRRVTGTYQVIEPTKTYGMGSGGKPSQLYKRAT